MKWFHQTSIVSSYLNPILNDQTSKIATTNKILMKKGKNENQQNSTKEYFMNWTKVE